MPNLNNKILQACPVPYPRTLKEQQQTVAALDALGKKMAHHESKKAALQDLFKTTLNKLMTGDIRVADLDIDVKEVEV
jgi:type I restriction enzyme S subunit